MNIGMSETNITAKIVSVIFAIILWFHVTSNSTFNYKYSLPIQYVGPSEGFIIASKKPDEVLITIRGSGRKLLIFSLMEMFISPKHYAIINLAGLPKGLNQVTIEKSSINLGVDSGLEVENILYPDNAVFSIEIDRKIKRTVAVNVDSLAGYSVAKGFVENGKPVVKPNFVLIQGPENIVNTINSIKVSPFKGETVTQKKSALQARFEMSPFVSVDPEIVEIFFQVEPLISRRLTGVPLVLRGFPVKNRPVFKPDTLTITVRGPESLVSGMKSENIIVSINYQMFKEYQTKGDSLITPNVTYPEGVTSVSWMPGTILFHLPSHK